MSYRERRAARKESRKANSTGQKVTAVLISIGAGVITALITACLYLQKTGLSLAAQVEGEQADAQPASDGGAE